MRRWLKAAVVFVALIATTEARPRPPREVTSVRYWSLPGTTSVAIKVTGDVRYRSDCVGNPNRIFIDFVGARPHIQGRRSFSTDVGDKLLKSIRVAETSRGVTRVVLDLESAADFSVSRLHNPSRLVIRLRPAATAPADDEIASAGQVDRESERAPDPKVTDDDATPPRESRTKAKLTSPSGILVETPAASTTPPSGPSDDSSPEASHKIPPQMVPRAAHTSSDGERSMVRALGLKINRVVIDPGHGGSDQGTVGQGGLKEKDLVLDVAKRLGKLIDERMGSEVIYTRTDDTFVPLQARTEMANENKADVFLSIHANSSPHPVIGGIEVYYLNFTRSADALDVAARENASLDKSLFELRGLVETIAMHDKIEESKEFAGKMQQALQRFEIRYNGAAKNRGVKKAPFVVLIGASMPSILAEIGFLSNAREEQLLKRPDHRQRLAEALFQGVSRYAQSLSHFQEAQRASAE